MPRMPVRVGTDCSGLDAPVFALKAVKLPGGVQHVFSCENDARKRRFLEPNNPAVPLHSDMLGRRHENLPRHDLYVCGFPCKSFSRLHVKQGI